MFRSSKCSIDLKLVYEWFNNNLYDISFFDFVNVYFTDNIKEDTLLFCTPKSFENLDNSGVTILPNNILEETVVLIDTLPNNLLDISRAMLHEFVHVYDYNEYAKYYLNGQYDGINDHEYMNTYSLWSEFRAFSIAEINSYKFNDYINDTNLMSEFLKTYGDNLANFLLKEREKGMANNFLAYDVAEILGNIYVVDNYKNIENVSDSFVFQFLPLVFQTDVKNQIYKLYELYFRADKEHDFGGNLKSIQEVEDRMFG